MSRLARSGGSRNPLHLGTGDTDRLPRNLIANAFLAYTAQSNVAQGPNASPVPAVPYVYAGWRPHMTTVPHQGPGWDCSGSFAFVMAHDLGCRTLPGLPADWYGRMPYHPGPAENYLTWDKTFLVGSAPGAVAECVTGDLLVWSTHIGVYISPDRMVSALSAAWATYVSPPSWGPSSSYQIRRLNWAEYVRLKGYQP